MSVSNGLKALIGVAALLAAPQAFAQATAVTLNAPGDVIPGGASAQTAGDTSRWVTDADYPPEARAAGESGEVGFVVMVDDSGMVSDCRVTRSSGSKALDKATCRLMRKRARFLAARDGRNEPTSARWESSVTWSLWREVRPADPAGEAGPAT
jgi:TonB family protein